MDARLTVIEQVYFQTQEADPTLASANFGRVLNINDQPYSRPLREADTEWQSVDFGWLADGPVSRVTIVNHEKALDSGMILEIGVALPDDPLKVVEFGLVRPGESAGFEPINRKTYKIRCIAGTARYTATIFPG